MHHVLLQNSQIHYRSCFKVGIGNPKCSEPLAPVLLLKSKKLQAAIAESQIYNQYSNIPNIVYLKFLFPGLPLWKWGNLVRQRSAPMAQIFVAMLFHNDNEWKWWSEGLPLENIFKTTFSAAHKKYPYTR